MTVFNPDRFDTVFYLIYIFTFSVRNTFCTTEAALSFFFYFVVLFAARQAPATVPFEVCLCYKLKSLLFLDIINLL